MRLRIKSACENPLVEKEKWKEPEPCAPPSVWIVEAGWQVSSGSHTHARCCVPGLIPRAETQISREWSLQWAER